MEYTSNTLSELRHKLKDHLGSFESMIFDVTNRNRMRAVLGQGLKETAILNSSDFGFTPLHITGFLILRILSVYHYSTSHRDNGISYFVIHKKT